MGYWEKKVFISKPFILPFDVHAVRYFSTVSTTVKALVYLHRRPMLPAMQTTRQWLL
jgi:hypothetical protein